MQQVVGGTHKSLIIGMKDYLIVFEAPINEWQSPWTIDADKAKYPTKPIKYLVLTHHHMDHHVGARTYVARGVSFLVPRSAKAVFESEFRAPHTVNPDELHLQPRAANIIAVENRMTLKDATDEVRLYNIADPHVQGMLIGYDAGANRVCFTDLFSPLRDKVMTQGMVAFADDLNKIRLTQSRLAGGHGALGPMSELPPILATE